MLAKIKLLLGITDNTKDALLNLLIDQAIDQAINITHNDAVSSYDSIIASMVVWRYNRLGSEGVTSENYSGVSFNYSSDYPEPLLKELNSFRKVRTI